MMQRVFFHILLFPLLSLWVAGGDVHAQERLLIIANPAVPVSEMDINELNRIFMLKRQVWSDGTPVVPVNREASSKERQQFTDLVLGRSMRSLANYWNQMQFKGFMPPVVQESNAAVTAFVRNVDGAIGYVVAETPPDGVRLLGEIP